MSRAPPIYVEIRIHGPLDELWRLTQTPDLHQRWDLRFTNIDFLPRPDPAQPQRFRYATRVGFGRRIEGEGESVGENLGPAGRSSALKFWSNDPKSLIREGSGYWKYMPTDDGIRFLTRYDYRTRFGAPGAMVDRLVFRPMLGWATAWSFDRLRLWIERGIDPVTSMRRCAAHAITRLALAFIWLYQGLVPKLIFPEASGELETIRRVGLFEGREPLVLHFAAAVEIIMGLATVMFWRVRGLLTLQIVLLVLLGIAAAAGSPRLFTGQFNPATLTLAMVALALIGLIEGREIPSAANCLRREARSTA